MSKSPKPGKFRQEESRKKMAGSSASLTEIIKFVVDNVDTYDTLDCSHAPGVTLSIKQHEEIAKGLETNTHIQTVHLAKQDINNQAAKAYAEAFTVNSTITKLDIGYNKIGGEGMIALAKAFKVNSNLVECKIHRQSVEMGAAAEIAMVELWDTNITLTRLYATLHDRRCNQANTKGEVRNKSIAKCIRENKSYLHLDPNRKEEYKAQKEKELRAKEEAERLANAPITEQVASTGGPYTLKQLTCKSEFQPADIDTKIKASYLSDEEFNTVFNMTKDEFNKLAGWKKQNLKKKKKLH